MADPTEFGEAEAAAAAAEGDEGEERIKRPVEPYDEFEGFVSRNPELDPKRAATTDKVLEKMVSNVDARAEIKAQADRVTAEIRAANAKLAKENDELNDTIRDLRAKIRRAEAREGEDDCKDKLARVRDQLEACQAEGRSKIEALLSEMGVLKGEAKILQQQVFQKDKEILDLKVKSTKSGEQVQFESEMRMLREKVDTLSADIARKDAEIDRLKTQPAATTTTADPGVLETVEQQRKKIEELSRQKLKAENDLSASNVDSEARISILESQLDNQKKDSAEEERKLQAEIARLEETIRTNAGGAGMEAGSLAELDRLQKENKSLKEQEKRYTTRLRDFEDELRRMDRQKERLSKTTNEQMVTIAELEAKVTSTEATAKRDIKEKEEKFERELDAKILQAKLKSDSEHMKKINDLREAKRVDERASQITDERMKEYERIMDELRAQNKQVFDMMKAENSKSFLDKIAELKQALGVQDTSAAENERKMREEFERRERELMERYQPSYMDVARAGRRLLSAPKDRVAKKKRKVSTKDLFGEEGKKKLKRKKKASKKATKKKRSA